MWASPSPSGTSAPTTRRGGHRPPSTWSGRATASWCGRRGGDLPALRGRGVPPPPRRVRPCSPARRPLRRPRASSPDHGRPGGRQRPRRANHLLYEGLRKSEPDAGEPGPREVVGDEALVGGRVPVEAPHPVDEGAGGPRPRQGGAHRLAPRGRPRREPRRRTPRPARAAQPLSAPSRRRGVAQGPSQPPL
jgi:hypothetical protein